MVIEYGVTKRLGWDRTDEIEGVARWNYNMGVRKARKGELGR